MSGGTNEKFEWESNPASESETTTLLSTGIEVLDRKLGGGIPEGTIIALSARPASQSELFLYEMAAVRETAYLTTERRVTDIETSLEDSDTPLGEITIQRLEADTAFRPEQPPVADLPDRSLVIVDPVNPLEQQSGSEYRTFLNEIKRHAVENQGIALLHCLDGDRTPTQRDRTAYHSDIIFSLNTRLRGSSIENDLTIPKFRGGRALPEAIDLDLSAEVSIDVSRKIA